MTCNVFINFDGNCREAVTFYAKIFNLELPDFLTYGNAPGGSSPQDAERILYAPLPVAGGNMMFSDCPSDFPLNKGNNVSVSIGIADKDELTRIYTCLSEGGSIHMPLGETFFNSLFAMFTDKFGVLWQISLNA